MEEEVLVVVEEGGGACSWALFGNSQAYLLGPGKHGLRFRSKPVQIAKTPLPPCQPTVEPLKYSGFTTNGKNPQHYWEPG